MKVFIIVLNWNGRDDTVACVNSLRGAGIDLSDVIIVDNASTDNSTEKFSEVFSGAHLIRNCENLGYTGGNNAGLRYALSLGADAVYLLNNDTKVSPDFLEPIISLFANDRSVGIAGSKVYFFERPGTVWFGNPVMNRLTGRTRDTEYGKSESKDRTVKEVPFISGCAFAVRREVIEKVGFFDERFFCYAEELDFCFRAWANGFRIAIVPDSKIYHKVSGSTGGPNSGITAYYRVRNHLLVFNKNLPLGNRIGTLLRNWSIVLLHLAAIFKLGMDLRRGIARLIQGVKDYSLGRFGKAAGL